MKKDELKTTGSNSGNMEMTKKVYKAPSVKEYGNINDLVKANPGSGGDAGANDDFIGS